MSEAERQRLMDTIAKANEALAEDERNKKLFTVSAAAVAQTKLNQTIMQTGTFQVVFLNRLGRGHLYTWVCRHVFILISVYILNFELKENSNTFSETVSIFFLVI